MKFTQIILSPFAFLYGAAVRLRNEAYNRHYFRQIHPGGKIISVGNLSAGGTGKTPVAMFLMQKLHALGYKPAYLSRGYGRKTHGFLVVDPEGDASRFGDEALQVAARFPKLPVAVCEDRVTGAKKLREKFKPDVIILDDAFQHRKIARDLDLILMDAGNMPDRDFLLPAGRLREPLPALKRAGIILVNKVNPDHPPKTDFIPPSIPVFFSRYTPKQVVPFFPDEEIPRSPDQPVILFSGIGNPAYFSDLAKQRFPNILKEFRFPDHHDFSEGDIAKILSIFDAAGNDPKPLLLTTEKDFFRLKNKPGLTLPKGKNLAWIQVGLEILEKEEEFIQLILKESALHGQ